MNSKANTKTNKITNKWSPLKRQTKNMSMLDLVTPWWFHAPRRQAAPLMLRHPAPPVLNMVFWIKVNHLRKSKNSTLTSFFFLFFCELYTVSAIKSVKISIQMNILTTQVW